MGAYNLNLDYDYTKHWSHRDIENPRLKMNNTCEVWNYMAQRGAERMAMNCFENEDWFDNNKIEAEFVDHIQSEVYHIVTENLYGWGLITIDALLEKGYDLVIKSFCDLTRKSTLDYFQKRLKFWWHLHLRDVSVRYNNVNDFINAEQVTIKMVYPSGVTEKDWIDLKTEEHNRVNVYLANESKWKTAAGGYWVGD